MDKKELKQLSKSQLIDIILNLKEHIRQLEQFVRAFDNPHTPSSKKRSKQNTTHDEAARFPGKPKGSNGGGIDMPTPDKEEKITKDDCPECGKSLGKPYDFYRFRQMDIPEPKFITTLYIVGLYRCNSCEAEIDAGEDLNKGFYGANTEALIGYLKKEGLSCDAIAELFNDVYNMPISNVAVFDKLTNLTISLAPEKELIANAINSFEYAHLDETGLRKDGQNGFVWNASTPKHCLFQFDRSRASDVAKRMLLDFKGAIITDDYQGYAWHSIRQLCWSHLLREAKEFAEKYPDKDIYIILDNWRAHTSFAIRIWNFFHPRIHLIYLPTNASWMNMIERVFSKFDKDVLQNSNFQTVKEAMNRIANYFKNELSFRSWGT